MGTGNPRRLRSAAAGVLAIAFAAAPSAAHGFDPLTEALNYSKNQERLTYDVLTPEFQLLMQARNIQGPIERAAITANDPERQPSNVCTIRGNECAGEVRFYTWDEPDDYGIKTPVVFTARSGAVISGTVWGTEAGPADRPAVVITTGSVQAPETLYWGLAANLAKAGYVVLTYDVQGQGQSDTLGEAPDTQEGVPSQAGQPFYDGSEDALDFLLSAPGSPYDPRPSCGNANGGVGTDHSPKHDRRVGAGLATAFNPLHHLVDPSRVGIAGHSLGAAGVSFVGQKDPRVDAVVGWDNLRYTVDGPDDGNGADGVPECPSQPASRDAAANLKPALGMSADYFIVPTPYTTDPDPQEKNAAFAEFKAAGVDTMQVNIRGGSHEEFAFIPGMTVPIPLGQASLRGHHMTAFYTRAWLDKYVRCQGGACTPAERADADARLLSDRWRNDPGTLAIDPNTPKDPNAFSFYLRSRYDVGLAAGGDAVCDDMRTGCATMGPDGGPPEFSYLDYARTADTGPGPGPGPDTDGDGTPDASDSCPSVSGTGGDGCPAAGASSGPNQPQPSAGTCATATPLRGTRRADRLVGTPDADLIVGRRGRDRLNGLAGRDCLRGGKGRDRINARDGEQDQVNCGRGRDRVRADRIDVLRRCERRR
jgi:dienelactone hydrolase